jgi:hypothetical protein
MVAAILTAGTACGALLAPYFPAPLLRLAVGSLALLGALGLALRLV